MVPTRGQAVSNSLKCFAGKLDKVHTVDPIIEILPESAQVHFVEVQPKSIKVRTIDPIVETQPKSDKVHTVDPIVRIRPSTGNPIVEPVNFPPAPLENDLAQKIISGFCKQSSPSALEEAGCAVCGKLCRLNQLTRLKTIKNLLPILQASGVTKIECCKAEQPVREFKGPVLDYSCNRVCDECRLHLQKGKVPRDALANGLWLGAVPDVLSCLSFVEKMLIARVHVNSCFI